MKRRDVLRLGLAAAGLVALRREQEGLPPVRAITRPPGFHWFGYYDKLQFDPGSRFALCMRVDFEHRTPAADDSIGIGMVDLKEGDRWIELGRSRAFSWQQGCMLQWVPGSDRLVLWNDRQDDRFVCRLHDVRSGETRTVPEPIYALAPDGEVAVSADFRRIQALRPGYGYVGLDDPHAEELAPDETGVFRIDLESGRSRLLYSLARLAATEPVTPDMNGAKHYVNHLLFSPDGQRFIFLHRWRPRGGRDGFRTRMFTADRDGGNLHLLDGSGRTSHFIWRDDTHVAAWSAPAGKPRGFYLFTDRGEEIEPIGAGVLTRDGHLSYLPGGRFLLNDTYPGRERIQHPHLFELETGRVVPLGHFHSPPEYRGEWRCDTHPRFSPDGRQVVIDSTHEGEGRQMYRIDLSGLV